MIMVSFKLNDGTIDFINFSKDYLAFLDDSDLIQLAEIHFRKKYNDDSITVLSCGGNNLFLEDEYNDLFV